MERHLGFMDAIKPYPGIQVIASEGGNWKEEGGTKGNEAHPEEDPGF